MPVLIAQCVVSFAVWIAYGVWWWRGKDRIRQGMTSLPKSRRAVFGALLMAIGGVWLLAGLLAIQAFSGMNRDGLKWWAWIAVTFVGLGFVAAQTRAAALMASAAFESDTPSPAESSMMQKTEDLEP